MSGQQHDEWDEFERQLAAIEPRASRIDRAELLFRAGRESVDADRGQSTSRAWVWQLSTALLALLVLGLAWRMHNVQPETVERIKYVQVPSQESLAPDSTLAEDGPRIPRAGEETGLLREHYLQQRRVAVSYGLDALGDPWTSNHAVPGNLTSYRDLKVNLFDRDDSNAIGASPSERNQQL